MRLSQLATLHQLFEQPSGGKLHEQLCSQVLSGPLTIAIFSQFARHSSP